MPADSLNFEQVTYFAILIIAFILLITQRIRNDLVALLIILSLAITGLLTAEEALSGFASEPAVIVVAIFVLSGALKQTGVSETVGEWIGRFTGKTYTQAISVIMPTVAVLSAFTHHLTTTAFMVPIILDFSEKRKIPASKLLIPLAFAASLGTTITIIGAPAFLIASSVLEDTGQAGLGIFSIAPIGIAITILGTIYMVIVGRYLLPVRQGSRDIIGQMSLDNYFTELTILDDSRLVGKTLKEVKEARKYEFTVAGWIREGKYLRRGFSKNQLMGGDVLLVYTTSEDLATLHQDDGVELNPIEKFREHFTEVEKENGSEMHLIQAVVAPRSEMIGRSLRDVNFRQRYGALVVAFWRQGSFIRQELAKIKLQEGDVLVLQGDDDAFSRIGRDRAFLMLVPFQGQSRLRRKAPLAILIMLATIVVAVLNIVELPIVMVAGALAVIFTGCITPNQAYQSIDTRSYIFIAGAIPLGVTMQTSGSADLIANWLQQTMNGWSQFPILITIFVVTAILTQFMSDAATTALFAPLAISLARSLGHAPEPYVVTIAMASVAAFLTPIGHHGNLLVYGPGGYRFNDFLRIGVPLTAIIAPVVVGISLLLWQA